MIRRLAFALVLVVAVLGPTLSAAGVLVAFQTAEDGGVARVEIDAEGRQSSPVVLFRATAFAAAAKLRVSADGRHATLNAETEGGENFAILPLPAGTSRLLALDFTPEEHRIDSAGRAYVGGTDGHLAALDLAGGAITHRWNSRHQLEPAGHKPEDLLVLEPEGLLLVSHQKDSKKGRLGSRLVVLRLADLSLVADLPLPRDHPELHLSEKEAGPSPEVIRVDRATNTLLLTLDLYGALAFADLDAALAGRLEHYLALPTSADGAWGVSFADRLALARVGDRSLAIVSNASADGGLAVFDVAARRRLAFYPVESGCAEPVLVNEGRTLATVVSGKRKRVLGDALENVTTPGTDLLLLDLARAAAGDSAALVR
ncbi:MAG: hypothetical protein H7067_08780, partial [Burkholderiales bacterium]|nr:hypothetical protein [Opitutaceae bacterium]